MSQIQNQPKTLWAKMDNVRSQYPFMYEMMASCVRKLLNPKPECRPSAGELFDLVLSKITTTLSPKSGPAGKQATPSKHVITQICAKKHCEQARPQTRWRVSLHSHAPWHVPLGRGPGTVLALRGPLGFRPFGGASGQVRCRI